MGRETKRHRDHVEIDLDVLLDNLPPKAPLSRHFILNAIEIVDGI